MNTKILGLIICLSLAVLACTKQQTNEQIQNATTKEFNVEAFQFGYAPSEIHVNKGDRVIINLKTRDVPHSLTIQDFGVNIPATADTPGRGEFIANTKGVFTWRCRMPCGEGHQGMTGTLVVE